MRNLPFQLAFLSISFLFIVGCQKKEMPAPSQRNQLIAIAERYYLASRSVIHPGDTGNYRFKTMPPIDWNEAEIIELPGRKLVRVPINYGSGLMVKSNFNNGNMYFLKDLAHLVYYQIGDTPILEIITAFPDSDYSMDRRTPFSGIMFVEDLSGQRVRQLKIGADGSVYLNSSLKNGKASGLVTGSGLAPDMFITMCYEIEGYNYEADNPEGGYSALHTLNGAA